MCVEIGGGRETVVMVCFGFSGPRVLYFPRVRACIGVHMHVIGHVCVRVQR